MDIRILTFLSVSFFSAIASAHGGHDHSHWLAGFVHLLWIAPLIIGAVLVVLAINYLDKRTNSGEK
ncbi:hypothetical protein ATN88_08355 [Enterovibrio coralii]|uniref:Uncharacterized protein n=1 Tax=Enterovibrio coralii TaxID=294935 RepID=A0A135I5C6_9GAMM|nr:hypothetical protein ATN88_08355 [Enterovibrio coralii]